MDNVMELGGWMEWMGSKYIYGIVSMMNMDFAYGIDSHLAFSYETLDFSFLIHVPQYCVPLSDNSYV